MISFKKLFILIFLPIALIFAGFFYFDYRLNVQNISDELLKFMTEKWISVSALDLDNPDSEKTHEILKKATEGTNTRVTLIYDDGSVINDSAIDYKQIKILKTHALRNEFRKANLGEPSYDIRKSASTGKNTVYYAKKLGGKQNNIVLRIAYDAQYLDKMEENLLKESLALASFLLIAVAILSAFLAKKFSDPVKKLNLLAENMEKEKKDGYFPPFDDATFNKISEVMYKIGSKLTEEKNSTEKEKAKLDTVFKSMNEGIILFDKNGSIIHVNEKAMEYLGIKLHEGQNLIKDGNNVDLILFFKNFEDSHGLVEIKYKDVIFEAYSKKIDGETLVVFEEITEKLNYEAFKTELIGNITHEIKTPLAVIMGASETILNDKDMDLEVKNKFISTIHKNSVRLNNIVNDTLELHKLEYYKTAEVVDKAADVKEITEEMKTLFQGANFKEIIFDVPDISVNIRADHISSILTNLISNAQKYADGDKIFVKIEKNKKRLEISVTDTGPAIPESERKRIFERFYTVSKSRTTNSAGSGLGLAIVKHIAEIYKGKASLYQNTLGGNTFEVILKEKP